ncbi:hypothetical protein HAZT_HAZT006177 [Hyalella azteca]|uniref:Uncharacterized protein n=1 Tax=Hyalella azteca TaxID=294128 RepID=A0A6A0GV39_HYAAZ|nr:hypothetical protein HAZT_HAZT006177 [Hyalella azteca]
MVDGPLRDDLSLPLGQTLTQLPDLLRAVFQLGAHRPTLALIHFLQFYCNGLRHCAVELAHFLISHSILIAAIQESKLTEASNPPSFPGYTLVRCDRPIVVAVSVLL